MASILVIDSEPTVRVVLTRILERGEHVVRSTGDFWEAIFILQSQKTDIVLTNMFLEGIAGHDAMKQLRRQFPKIWLLMVSGLPDEKAIAEWWDDPRFDIFPKPFEPDALLAKVEDFLSIDRRSES